MTATAAFPALIGAGHRRASGREQWRPLGALEVGPHRCADKSRLETRRRARVARVRRRRVVLAAATIGMLVALALPWGGAGGHTLAASGSVLAGAALEPHTLYIVQPGDNMWTIAERLSPRADPRVVVAQLEQQVGSDTLQPGDRLTLP
ncbi:MAG: LysM peptidoglycan-binding domain-containing protein [Acidimicrobiales bacterium]